MRDINKIVLHHSESPGGDADFIRHIHVHDNGWKDIGYHYIITNGRPHGEWKAGKDGEVQKGRPVEQVGAHARGHNEGSIGVCLIGDFDKTRPTIMQLFNLVGLLVKLCHDYNINPLLDIVGHRDVNETACPGHNLYMFIPIMRMFIASMVDYAD